jgi:hypothetical protein
MRRILIAATVLFAACGGKKTVPATAEIKASATQAQLGMSSASTNTQATIGLQSIGSSVADAVASGSAATVDLGTGLGDPGSLAAVAMVPPPGTLSQNLRASDPFASVATMAVGCLQRDAAQTPTLYSTGQGGCTASDHLEVTYDNGDKVNITWSESDTSFDLLLAVVAGPWNGTNLHYAGSGNLYGATVTVSGAMKYAKAGNPVHVDADFNLSYAVTGSQTTDGANIGISVNGTATDHIALVRANEHWNLNMQTSAGPPETVVMDWSGGIGVDLLKADGKTTDHSVAFNVNMHVVSQSSGQSGSVTWSAAGDVDYDGAVAGNLVSKNNQLYIDWNDGTEVSFDPAVLFGSFGV